MDYNMPGFPVLHYLLEFAQTHVHWVNDAIQPSLSLIYGPTFTYVHGYWKNCSFDYMDICWQSNISAFPHIVYVCHHFPAKKKIILISWLQSLSAVILELKQRKFVTISPFSPSICHEVMGLDAVILVFLNLSFQLALSLSSFTLIKGLFISSSLFAIEWYHLFIWGCWYFSQLYSSLWFIQPGISHDVLCA